ncbi:DUF5389 family protein [Glaesserella parasuis]|nr:DUF5389 family protein [Glaesserella parasuis]MDO9756854.1 DUF5389 family protein [Glaesserella parasuis]MDO9785681.1 DUF5389 family protein [Glaesserella parasuis]MDO9869739.1 DUF5389 family protein [Glaesserella parasuis]MDO9892113.1 DUF5389 family protein [Glaesserella parasuis]
MQQGFSKFSWALAFFCLPSSLWPLALLVSPALSENPNLSPSQIDWFSTAFWIYPFILLAIAGLLHKLHQKQPLVAKIGLLMGYISFYDLICYIIRTL